MNLGEKTRAIAETSITTTLMVAFALIGLYFIPTVIIFFPIPFIVIGVRHGTKYNILALIASSLLIGVLTNLIIGLLMFITFGFLSISFSYMLKRKFKQNNVLIFSFGVALVSILLSITMFDVISGTSLIESMEGYLNDVLTMQVEGLKGLDISSYELSQMEDYMKSLFDYMLVLFPFFILTSAIVTTYVVYWGAVVVLRRFGYKNITLAKFKLFNLPKHIILGSVIMILGSIIIKYIKVLYFESIFINITAIIIFVFFLQGLAVIIYFMDKFKLNKVLKVILVILAIINSAVISLVGLIDVLFNLRKLGKSN
ncbi:DUF2232 domain-containing protein [Sporosalibacterium faouarense]|uniref:DUF2232 domain-containing protein n=1 Tax=Sporosalibacterium faouarense TaxID=516123 RepID=UPI00141CB7D7|nr:DUF2232 domain-containing protein [Sporosalibacterium faouarense]MTI46225.1 DUF2232 domain-containing protein [Bacillota bacterium]